MTASFFQTAWLVPIYPLIAAILSLAWSPGLIRRTGPRPAGYLNITCTLLSVIHVLLALAGSHGQELSFSFDWLQTAGLTISFDGTVTPIALVGMLLITGLNFLAQVYSVGYLEMDWGWARFFACLSLFEAGLCALMMTDSLFLAYIILELLTLGTYLIVGTWYNQSLVVKGARDAFLTKRVGDLFLLAGVIALLPQAGTWNLRQLAEWAPTQAVTPVLTLTLLALVAGPLGKCAQMPLHLWLDEAMEGPLPSTILRNSVVVAGGAWVLVRLQPLVAVSPLVQSVLVSIGMVTAILAALIGIAQVDVKRAISYLVSSWLGLVFVAVGCGLPEVAGRMLLVYPLPMALLVMAVGTVIISNVTQDLTQMGGLWSRRPLMGIAFLVGGAGLVGLPPLGGFNGLSQLLEALRDRQSLLVIPVLAVNALIAFALVRIFARIWGGRPNEMTVRSPEVLWLMVLPTMVVLGLTVHLPIWLQQAGLTIAWGPLAWPLVWSTVTGGAIAALVYLRPDAAPVRLPIPAVQEWLASDLHTETLYKRTIVALVAGIAAFSRWTERQVVDSLTGLAGLVAMLGGQALRYTTTGRTQGYAFTLLLGVLLLGALALLQPPAPVLLSYQF
jgi:NAD(P)H-quinone oxidoreductase subunit 5